MISERFKMANTFEINDDKLIEKFVQGSNQLLASANLRLQVNGTISQLTSRSGEPIAIMYLQNKPRSVIIKQSSYFSETIDRLLIDRDFVMIGDANRPGFVEYKHYVTPAGYKLYYTDPSILWKKWWPTERFQNKQRFNMDILVSFKDNWYPVQNITVNAGIFTIKTIAGQIILQRDSQVLWLAQITNNGSVPAVEPAPIDELAEIKDRSPSNNLAKKIQEKKSAITSEQAWEIIQKLEQKLQVQVKENDEIKTQLNRETHRAIIAEQRLQVVYNYLQGIGINFQDIYSSKSNLDN